MITFRHLGGRWFERTYPANERAAADAYAQEINLRFRQREYFRLSCDALPDGSLYYRYQLHPAPLWPQRLADLLRTDPGLRV